VIQLQIGNEGIFFSLHHRVRPALGPTDPSIQWALSAVVKRPGRETNQSLYFPYSFRWIWSWNCRCASSHTTPWRRIRDDGTAPHIFSLGTIWRWVASFTLQSLYPRGKMSRFSLVMILGEPTFGLNVVAKRKSHAPAGNETPVVQTVADHQTNWLFRIFIRLS
jgi:hypothetical protein